MEQTPNKLDLIQGGAFTWPQVDIINTILITGQANQSVLADTLSYSRDSIKYQIIGRPALEQQGILQNSEALLQIRPDGLTHFFLLMLKSGFIRQVPRDVNATFQDIPSQFSLSLTKSHPFSQTHARTLSYMLETSINSVECLAAKLFLTSESVKHHFSASGKGKNSQKGMYQEMYAATGQRPLNKSDLLLQALKQGFIKQIEV